jgi:hypothetical protein
MLSQFPNGGDKVNAHHSVPIFLLIDHWHKCTDISVIYSVVLDMKKYRYRKYFIIVLDVT